MANVIRLRREAPEMIDAFETVLAPNYVNEHEDLSIIACGPMVPEAMRAAWILKQEFGYETRVVNMHTMKPIDERAIIRAAKETGVVITAEEHQIGALAWRVSGILTESPELYGVPVITGAIGVKDRFGDSGAPWELIKEFEVSAEHIAQKAVELLAIAKMKKRRREGAACALSGGCSIRASRISDYAGSIIGAMFVGSSGSSGRSSFGISAGCASSSASATYAPRRARYSKSSSREIDQRDDRHDQDDPTKSEMTYQPQRS